VTQIGTAYIKVVADTDELNRGLDKSSGSIAKFGKGLALAGGAAAGLAVVGSVLKSSIEAAQESERVSIALQKQVESTGASYEKYQQQIDDTIESTSMLAAVDDEDLAESFTKLVGSTGDVEDALAGMTAATDVAAARGVSLETATKGIEKALNGSVAGLKKYGITLDKNASRQEVLAALQKRFGGAAEAYGKTAAGAQQRFGVALENVQEQLGTALLPLVTKFFEAVTKGLDWWMKHWPEIEKAIKKTVDVARPYLEALGKQIRIAAEIVADVARLINAIAHGEWGKAWEALKNIVENIVRGIVNVIENLPIVKALKALIGKIVHELSNAVHAVTEAASKIGKAIENAILAPITFALDLGRQVLNGIRAAVDYVVTNFGQPFARLLALIVDKLSAIPEFYIGIGKRILAGIRAAIQYVIDKIGNPFTSLVDYLIEQLGNALDKFKRLGKKLWEGTVGRIPGVPNPFSAPAPQAAPATMRGVAPPGGAGVATPGALAAPSPFGGSIMGASARGLPIPGLGSATTLAAPKIEVRVFIGDQELRGIVRTEVGRSDTGIARTLLAGGPVG
jgi:hypothetical protein